MSRLPSRFHAIFHRLSLLIFPIFIGISQSLLCYDSSFPSPHSTQECGDGMMCYQEYYAIDRGDDRVDQYFERFCVAKRECGLRGFHGICTTFDTFDSAIKSTFEKYRLLTKGVNRTALAHSK
ncbi:unnamed protein product, partial [Mesorhabditis belari]|uniref:DUF7773 domain-containing protein n=1 Tax=Mesorhabditis belari TaxID=2138241 RepID=A0AAF3FFP8_9BILA